MTGTTDLGLSPRFPPRKPRSARPWPPGEAKEAALRAVVWTPGPGYLLAACVGCSSADTGLRQLETREELLSLWASEVTGIWQPEKWQLPVASKELRLAAGIQLELAAQRCRS